MLVAHAGDGWRLLTTATEQHVGRSAETRRARRRVAARVGTRLNPRRNPPTISTRRIAYLEEWWPAFPGGLLLGPRSSRARPRTKRLLEIDRGRAELSPRSERNARAAPGTRTDLAAAIERESRRRRRRSKPARTIERQQIAWRERGRTGERSKPKARIDAETPLLARGDRGGERTRRASSDCPGERRLGSTKGVALHGLSVSRGLTGLPMRAPPRARLAARSTTRSKQGDPRVGIVGPNGCGKSTLLDLHRRSPATHARRSRSAARVRWLYDKLGRTCPEPAGARMPSRAAGSHVDE